MTAIDGSPAGSPDGEVLLRADHLVKYFPIRQGVVSSVRWAGCTR